MVEYLFSCELCDRFNVMEGCTLSWNRLEPNRIQMILVFKCQRKVLSDEPMLIDRPSTESEDIEGILKI
jgi:uncharacterized protein YlaI